TIAGPVGYFYHPRPYQQPEIMYAVEESPLFVAQTLALPVTLVLVPPWEPIRYTGDTVLPTYNAMPALPGEANVVEAPAVQMPPQPEMLPPAAPEVPMVTPTPPPAQP